MKALILNSGVGRRMGDLTSHYPKCMTELATGETILSRQIRQLECCGIDEIVITTGPFADILEEHALQSRTSAHITFANNPDYAVTNYIYSIYLAREHLQDDILMLHGDLVFFEDILAEMLGHSKSSLAISTTLPLPEKDFKAVVENDFVQAVGIEFFDHAVAAQPLYHLKKQDWLLWLGKIEEFVADSQKTCYAENALNALNGRCNIYLTDVQNKLCAEIDTPEDLAQINRILRQGDKML